MKSVLTGILLMAVIGAIAWGVMQMLSEPAAVAFSSPNDTVRLD
jgi:hypothetical protein